MSPIWWALLLSGLSHVSVNTAPSNISCSIKSRIFPVLSSLPSDLTLSKHIWKDLNDGWVDGWMDGWMDGKAGTTHSHRHTEDQNTNTLPLQCPTRWHTSMPKSDTMVCSAPYMIPKYSICGGQKLMMILQTDVMDYFWCQPSAV